MNENYPEITSAIIALRDLLRTKSPDQLVLFSLTINCEEMDITEKYRTPEELKATGISMRNLKGEFIK